MITDPETMKKIAREVLAALRDRFVSGLGPIVSSEAIRIVPLALTPLSARVEDGELVMLYLEAEGEVYRVDVGWVAGSRARPEAFAWAPMYAGPRILEDLEVTHLGMSRDGSIGIGGTMPLRERPRATFKGRILPRHGDSFLCKGEAIGQNHGANLVPLDRYRNRCLYCGTETKTPADLFVTRGPVIGMWKAWLEGVQGTTFGHGAALVDAFGGAGVSDNVARAEALLKHATGVGWVVRGTNTPTTSQAFLDVNGDLRRQGWVTSGYAPGPFIGDELAYLKRWVE